MQSVKNRIPALMFVLAICCANTAYPAFAADYQCPGPDCVLDATQKSPTYSCPGGNCIKGEKNSDVSNIKAKKAKKAKKMKADENASMKEKAATSKYAPAIEK